MLICITGTIGSGKSTALKIIKAEGYQTLAMDEYIHSIYRKPKIGYELIKKHFGNAYVNSREVDRKKLGKLVFSSNKNLNNLNKLMIPLMQHKLQQMLDKSTLSFVEMGIYMQQETAFYKYFDKVILIKSDKNRQNENFKKKIPYLRKFPTILVGKLKLSTKKENKSRYIVVENHKNLNNFKESILKILKNLNK